MASLIVGKERDGSLAARTVQHYVRRAGGQTSYLVEGDISAALDPKSWVDDSLSDIAVKDGSSIETTSIKFLL